MTKREALYVAICGIIFLVCMALKVNERYFLLIAAEYNVKNNNVVSAINYYEKAFKAGTNLPKARDKYVNILINSPLTIENQQHLYNFIQIPVDDSARYKAKYFLLDLKKEILKKYPYNFIQNAVLNQQVLHWANMPITYSFAPVDFAYPDYFKEEFEKAFNEWEKVTEHSILFDKNAENSNNTNISIIFHYNPSTEICDTKYIVAYNEPIIEANVLKKMEIHFFINDMKGDFLTNNQVYNIALHEIAHSLGLLGHSFNKSHVMYISKDSDVTSNQGRAMLSQADINTVLLLYKIKPDITNSKEASGVYLPFVVLGNNVDVNNSKSKEAKRYIKKAPNLPNGYIDLAESYVAQKDYYSAITNLEKALSLANSDEYKKIIYFDLAVSYFYAEKYEKAKKYIEIYLSKEDSDDLHNLLAQIYKRQGKIKKAIKEYEYLLIKNPENIDYTIALANIYIRRYQIFKARKIFSNYLKLHPQDKTADKLKPYRFITIFL